MGLYQPDGGLFGLTEGIAGAVVTPYGAAGFIVVEVTIPDTAVAGEHWQLRLSCNFLTPPLQYFWDFEVDGQGSVSWASEVSGPLISVQHLLDAGIVHVLDLVAGFPAPTTTTTASRSVATTTPPPPSSPTGTAPVIDRFSASPASKSCNPATESSFPVNLAWSTSNSTGTTLHVDGPGLYASYGPSGSQVLNHSCEDTTHTYLLKVNGPGGSTQKTITFTIDNVTT